MTARGYREHRRLDVPWYVDPQAADNLAGHSYGLSNGAITLRYGSTIRFPNIVKRVEPCASFSPRLHQDGMPHRLWCGGR